MRKVYCGSSKPILDILAGSPTMTVTVFQQILPLN